MTLSVFIKSQVNWYLVPYVPYNFFIFDPMNDKPSVQENRQTTTLFTTVICVVTIIVIVVLYNKNHNCKQKLLFADFLVVHRTLESL